MCCVDLDVGKMETNGKSTVNGSGKKGPAGEGDWKDGL